MITDEIIEKMIHGAFVYFNDKFFGRISVDTPAAWSFQEKLVFICSDANIYGSLPENFRFGLRYGWCFGKVDDTITHKVNLRLTSKKESLEDIVKSIIIDELNSNVDARRLFTIKFEKSITLYDLC